MQPVSFVAKRARRAARRGLAARMPQPALPEAVFLERLRQANALRTEAHQHLIVVDHERRNRAALAQAEVTEDGGAADVDAPDAGRVIVELQGRERGFHDYQPDFYDPMLSPGCGYVVFGMRGDIWVADATAISAANGAAAPLVAGGASALFFAPR